MSRVANSPINIPSGVNVDFKDYVVNIKGPKGELNFEFSDQVEVSIEDNNIIVKKAESSQNKAIAGTIRSILNNMCTGVSAGFEKKLQLIGVGYRAQVQGKVLNLALGLSHPVNFEIPKNIKIETPSQTEIIVKGIDKQLVGEVSSKIRQYRPPEPYKGKGIRYSDENVVRKEAKKK